MDSVSSGTPMVFAVYNKEALYFLTQLLAEFSLESGWRALYWLASGLTDI